MPTDIKLWSCTYSFTKLHEIMRDIGTDSISKAGECFIEFYASTNEVNSLSFSENVKEVK